MSAQYLHNSHVSKIIYTPLGKISSVQRERNSYCPDIRSRNCGMKFWKQKFLVILFQAVNQYLRLNELWSEIFTGVSDLCFAGAGSRTFDIVFDRAYSPANLLLNQPSQQIPHHGDHDLSHGQGIMMAVTFFSQPAPLVSRRAAPTLKTINLTKPS